MALDLGGRRAEAERAYEWLVDLQRPDGSWHQYYVAGDDGSTGRAGQARRQRRAPTWPPACGTTGCSPTTRASSRRCGRSSSRPSTSCSTCRRPAARSSGPATPTAPRGASPCSPARRSICHSLRCAIAIAEQLGHERPDWELSAARLAHVIRDVPEAFAPKHRWAMDWYYPVLGGVVLGDAGRHTSTSADTFLMDGRACAACPTGRGSPWPRRASAPWPTSPSATARRPSTLFGWAQQFRHDERPLLDRHRLPGRGRFPGGERRTYTAASVVLGADALAGTSPASALFVDHDAVLPRLTTSLSDAVIDDSGGLRSAGRFAFRRRRGAGLGGCRRARSCEARRTPRARQVDLLVGRATAVGGVREHVVDGEQAAGRDVRHPQLVVAVRRLVAVTAVDEEERQRRRPSPRRRSASRRPPRRRCPRGRRRAPCGGSAAACPSSRPPGRRGRARATPSRAGSPPTAVVVEREQHRAALAGRRAEVHRRLAAVACRSRAAARRPTGRAPPRGSARPSSGGMKPRAASAAARSPDRSPGVVVDDAIEVAPGPGLKSVPLVCATGMSAPCMTLSGMPSSSAASFSRPEVQRRPARAEPTRPGREAEAPRRGQQRPPDRRVQ